MAARLSNSKQLWVPPISDVGEVDAGKVRSARIATAEHAIAGGWVGDLGPVLDMLGIGRSS